MSELGGKDDMNIISALGESPEGGPSKEDASNTVPVRFQGTRADQADMMMLGKKQVLRVSQLGHLLYLVSNKADFICSETSSLSPCWGLGRRSSVVGKSSCRKHIFRND